MFRITHTVFLFAALCSAAGAQTAFEKEPIKFLGLVHLELEPSRGGLRAYMHGPTSNYLGIVLLSNSPSQTYFLKGLPPILSNYVVLGFGFAQGEELQLWGPNPAPCKMRTLYG